MPKKPKKPKKAAYVVKAWADEAGELIIQAFKKGAARPAQHELPEDAGDEVEGELWVYPRANAFVVTHSRVSRRRQGIGTQMYEVAAKWGCKRFNLPLTSDEHRSHASNAFWEKQVRKGRAICLAPSLPLTQETLRNLDPEDRIPGRGGCVRFQLKPCPAPRTLTAARAKRS